MTTTRARKPASAAEHDALAAWRQARPATAMTRLADVGYDEAARAEFLRTVVRLAESDATDFSAGYYVTPAGDDYDAGVRDGAAAGALAFRNDEDTITAYDPDRTGYKDGYADGYVSGYHCQARQASAQDESGAYPCPCCGDTLIGDLASQPACDDCQAAGCEPNSHGDYNDCQRPCASCGDPRTADWYLHVTWARPDGTVTCTDGYICDEHLPDEADVPGAFIPSSARVLEYDARELPR
jgi:hypothetical protein